ncbi:MAG TPA: IPT/TIG domain-containing protein [Pantanalinema sp.]
MRLARLAMVMLALVGAVGCVPNGAPGTSGETPPGDATGGEVGAPVLLRLSRSAFLPNERITLYGQNFASDPAQNQINFEGASASAEIATTENLVVRVPAGVRSGALQVAVRGQRTGVMSYVVDPPEVATISASAAMPGKSLTIVGRRFSPVLSENLVSFNGTLVSPVSGGNGILRVMVEGTSGPLTVRTDAGSSDPLDFVVIPSLDGSFDPS